MSNYILELLHHIKEMADFLYENYSSLTLKEKLQNIASKLLARLQRKFRMNSEKNIQILNGSEWPE
ncbi:MAG: hypothetical protein WD059_02075 [Balneolaceae bacterium]